MIPSKTLSPAALLGALLLATTAHGPQRRSFSDVSAASMNARRLSRRVKGSRLRSSRKVVKTSRTEQDSSSRENQMANSSEPASVMSQ